MKQVEKILTDILERSESIPLHSDWEKNKLDESLILELQNSFPNLISDRGKSYSPSVRSTLNSFYRQNKIFKNKNTTFILEKTASVFEVYYFIRLI